MSVTFDSYRVEEAYSWRDDIMEITRRIVYELDEARMSNIAEHFEVDLSEIREFFEMKQRQKMKSFTNYDLLVRKTPEELAERIGETIDCQVCKTMHHSENDECPSKPYQACPDFWLDWLKKEVEA